MKKLTSFVTLAAVLSSVLCFGQQSTCGMEEYMSALQDDSVLYQQYIEQQQAFDALHNARRSSPSVSQFDGSLIIPVAVHFPTAQESDRSCLEALAQLQIDQLNEDYTATNADIETWNSISQLYPGTSAGGLDVTFCLATSNHPLDISGNPLEPSIGEGDPAVTIGYDFAGGSGFPEFDSNWRGYFNILVKSIDGSVAGYSALGGDVSLGMAVVIDTSYFGAGSSCPGSGISGIQSGYTRGRVLVHEAGHFFNLAHSFSDSCSNDDDNIADTPNYEGPIFGCTSPGGGPGCTSISGLTMNYMGYNYEDCMYMFTQGQVEYMQTWINILESSFKPNTTSCGSLIPDFVLSELNSTIQTCSDTATFQIQYQTTNGFDETASVSANCSNFNFVSSGAIISIDNTTISTDGIISLDILNIESLSTGDYPITVTVNAPSSSKEVNLNLQIIDEVCDSEGSMEYNTSITGVTFNTISNLNTGKTSPYSDYTSQSTEVDTQGSYDLSVNVNTDGNYVVVTKAWIDWNQNCNFDELTEEYDLGSISGVTNGLSGNSPLSITVPEDAVNGPTIMRISAKYTDPDEFIYATPCSSDFDGEVEEYTIVVNNTLSIEDVSLTKDLVSLYPNPTTTALYIKNDSNNQLSDYVIYTITGQLITRKLISSESDLRVDTSKFDPGVYFIKIRTANQSQTLSFVKK
jgi:hypothetical protein